MPKSFRFQEKYDIENAIERIASSEEPNTSAKTDAIEMDEDLVIITSTMESNETDDDGLFTDGERENKGTIRRGYSSCDECDIPFITKKQLKVNIDDYIKKITKNLIDDPFERNSNINYAIIRRKSVAFASSCVPTKWN